MKTVSAQLSLEWLKKGIAELSQELDALDKPERQAPNPA